jgi:hypothetical protein
VGFPSPLRGPRSTTATRKGNAVPDIRFDVTDDTGLARVRVSRVYRDMTGEDEVRLLVSGHEATGRPAAVEVVLTDEVRMQLAQALRDA